MAAKYGAYKGTKGRKVYVDFTGITWPTGSDIGRFNNIVRHYEGKAADPYNNLLGKTKLYTTPEELASRVEEYFNSCYGYVLNKVGNVVMIDGEPVIGQTTVFTRSGLILYLCMGEQTFYDYIHKARDGEIEPEYGEILQYALLRIDSQAERLLYDRDAGRGAEFYLKAFKKMTTAKEDSEIRKINAHIELSREEFELKKQMLGDDAGDTELVIEVVRKLKREGPDE